jgi:hypothetical protein
MKTQFIKVKSFEFVRIRSALTREYWPVGGSLAMSKTENTSTLSLKPFRDQIEVSKEPKIRLFCYEEAII